MQDFLPETDHNIGGTSMDFYTDSGIPFAFTIELPDLGQTGFQVPAQQISEVNFSKVKMVFLRYNIHFSNRFQMV